MKREKFNVYFANHQDLFHGLELTQGEIYYICNEIWDREVDHDEFHREFRQAIRRAWARYKMLKEIEFKRKIFELTTSNVVRKLTTDINRTLDRTNNNGGTRSHTGTDSNSGSAGHKEANRQLGMNSSGTSFNAIVNWHNGASGIGESNDTNSNTTTYNDTITTNDTQILKDIGHDAGNDKETVKRIEGQAVDLIRKIWNYIVEPKAIDYLMSEIDKSLIHII